MTTERNTTMFKQTIITLFADGQAEIQTVDPKWMSHLDALSDNMGAIPVECEGLGQAWRVPIDSLFVDNGIYQSAVMGDRKMKAEPKVKKAKRILTDEEKQVIRARFAAGKAKAALARGEVVAPVVTTKATKPVPTTTTLTDAKKEELKNRFAAGKAKAAAERGEVAPVQPKPSTAPDSESVKAAFERREAAKAMTAETGPVKSAKSITPAIKK